ncbi:DUF5994 family protein [Jiangella asiatica]|uniref:Uncharacterized protein n=1 Tax=Jiangella asiatica TaxID=2530372 RepID=A0A4R5CZQ7_9ACTN|nr:DUF5994 family protein [Jiangella asiatica]TDE03383.1 hypothetical protein E1269_20295 [Jiangella asiatica]
MRQVPTPFHGDIATARIAYRISRPGDHPRLHGVWWPRSDDLTQELPALVGALDSRGFRTEWVSLDRRIWGIVAGQMLVAGRIVRLGLFRSIDPHVVSLSAHDGRARIDLMVVPAASHPALATTVFARVLHWDNRSTASATLAAAAAAWDNGEAETPQPISARLGWRAS